MAEHPNVAATRAGMEAFNRGDVQAFADSIADDVVWHAPGNNRYSGTFEGKAANLERFKRQADDGVHLAFEEIHDVVGNDDHVVALVKLRFTGPTGEATTRGAFISHVRDGKMTEFWAFNEDQAAVDAVLGS